MNNKAENLKVVGKIGASRLSRNILKGLMDPASVDAAWSASDLRSLLEHQLATDLSSEVDQFAKFSGTSVKETAAVIEGSGCKTFWDLIATGTPSAAALLMLKEYGKGSLTAEDGLPRDVARVLYFAAILRGRTAGIDDMTSLGKENIQREVRRCLTFGWLPESVREFFKTASAGIK